MVVDRPTGKGGSCRLPRPAIVAPETASRTAVPAWPRCTASIRARFLQNKIVGARSTPQIRLGTVSSVAKPAGPPRPATVITSVDPADCSSCGCRRYSEPLASLRGLPLRGLVHAL